MPAARSTTTLALAGDTMLGRGVADALRTRPARALLGPALLEAVGRADGVLLNLECCVSERGRPWPGRVFHFRAPPEAVDVLHLLGASCVTLANNHALDFGRDALLDTLDHLRTAGIPVVGAGPDDAAARAPVTIDVAGLTLTVVAFADHPAEYAAGPGTPGTAYADLGTGVPAWLEQTVAEAAATGPVLAFPHWGPNMTPGPPAYVRRAARRLRDVGATVVAGHSAHVFHGVAGRVLFDLGDFLDDYAVDPVMRNDLGLLWLLTFEDAVPRRVEAFPLRLDFCRTELATGEDAAEVRARFRAACRALGTEVEPGEHLVVRLDE